MLYTCEITTEHNLYTFNVSACGIDAASNKVQSITDRIFGSEFRTFSVHSVVDDTLPFILVSYRRIEGEALVDGSYISFDLLF